MQNNEFKALADPTRRKILELLSKKGELSAGEIASQFSISAPSISHHLAILRNAGLITDERQGQSILYRLNTTVFQEVIQWFYTMLEGGEENDKK